MAGGSLGEQTTAPCVHDRWFWEQTPLCKPKGYDPEFYDPRKGLSGELANAAGIDTGRDLAGWGKLLLAVFVLWLLVRAYEAYKR